MRHSADIVVFGGYSGANKTTVRPKARVNCGRFAGVLFAVRLCLLVRREDVAGISAGQAIKRYSTKSARAAGL